MPRSPRRARRRTSTLLLGAVLAGAVLTGSAGTGDASPRPSDRTPSAVATARPGWSPVLAAAVERYRTAVTLHRDATAVADAAAERLAAAAAVHHLTARTAADRAAEGQASRRRAEERRDAAQALAVAAYVNGGLPATPLLDGFDPDAVHGMDERDRAGEAMTIAGVGARDEAVRAAAEATAREALARRAAQRTEREVRVAEADDAQARERRDLAGIERASAAAALRRAREEEPMPGTDVPGWLFDVYVAAAGWRSALDPGCALDWSLLAAIGRTESRHGRYGAGIDRAGNLPPILGPALDGVEWPTVITDTDGGALDGNPAFDHAVGPMQFLPSTWAAYGVDGNGDGVANPHNVRDAIASAARYLCDRRGGLRLDTPEGRRAALWAYNPSEAYHEKVTATAEEYAEAPAGAGWLDLLLEPEDLPPLPASGGQDA